LAGRLGSFLAQAGSGGIEAIQIVYGGALTEAKTDLVRNPPLRTSWPARRT
jgi:D-3-phosphoglycerate dehydrogenase